MTISFLSCFLKFLSPLKGMRKFYVGVNQGKKIKKIKRVFIYVLIQNPSCCCFKIKAAGLNPQKPDIRPKTRASRYPTVHVIRCNLITCSRNYHHREPISHHAFIELIAC